jgi:hypothetical protein
MQDNPASIFAISDTESGTTFNPHFSSIAMVRGHPAFTNTTSLTRNALAALRSSPGTTRTRNPFSAPEAASASVASTVSSSINEQSDLRCKVPAGTSTISPFMPIDASSLRRPAAPARSVRAESPMSTRPGVTRMSPPSANSSCSFSTVVKPSFEGRRQFLRLRPPARRPRPKQHRRLTKHQRRILDKHRIRKLLQGVEYSHFDSGAPQRGDVRLMLGYQCFEHGRRPRRCAQSVDNTPAGSTNDGRVEVEHAHASCLHTAGRASTVCDVCSPAVR